jgi:hypothetical protein
MTDHDTAAPPAEDHATTDAPLFSPAELREFDADDVEAGKNLCKMLSLFFFYTVIVMGLSTYVTYVWVMN